MFDEEGYQSDQVQKIRVKKQSKVLVPSSGSDFNHLTGEGQTLYKVMKERGFDITEKQATKMKQQKKNQKSSLKAQKPKAGYFDGGNSATIEQLKKALNKSIINADPQQTSCILSYLLQKKNLNKQDKNKYGLMKSNILLKLGAFQECINKVNELIQNTINKFSYAVLSHLLSKCKLETDQIFEGYFDLLRSKSLINQAKYEQNSLLQNQQDVDIHEQFLDSEIDIVMKEIHLTQLQYNIKLSKYKTKNTLVNPHFQQFKKRIILSIACGDHHAIFLIGNTLFTNPHNAKTQVFGVGQNTQGQITGQSHTQIFKNPVLVASLSGKDIQGIFASKQTSFAYDKKGNIYQWGVKEQRNGKIQITYSLNEEIKQFQKGLNSYAALTKSNKLYVWGSINIAGSTCLKQSKPKLQLQKIMGFSCGDNHIIAYDEQGSIYGLGDNREGQLGLNGQFLTKNFKIINTNLGSINNIKCLQNCTFFITKDQELYFCGKYSETKQSQQKIRQGQFPKELDYIVDVCGRQGMYYVTNYLGETYKWDVDSSVKFKSCQTTEKQDHRCLGILRGMQYYVKYHIDPNKCKMERKTKKLQSFSPIEFKINLRDKMGPYGNQLIQPLRFQLFFSTYKIDQKELEQHNCQYLTRIEEIQNDSQKIKITQIIQQRLMKYNLERDANHLQQCNLSITSDRAGKYFFYVMLDYQQLYFQEIAIDISDYQKQLEQKSKKQRTLEQEERKKNTQLDKQKRMQQKQRKRQEEEERRRQTQRRAQQKLRKFMKEQEQRRQKAQQDRKRRAEMQTGGGFDLSKLKK